MATSAKDTTLTWQEKLDQGLPLSPLEETKADADFNYQRRLEEEKERKAFEDRKNRGRAPQAPAADESDDTSGDDSDNSNSNDGKKGSK